MSRLFFICCIIAALVFVALTAGCVAWRLDLTVLSPSPSLPEHTFKDIENEREKKDAAAAKKQAVPAK